MRSLGLRLPVACALWALVGVAAASPAVPWLEDSRAHAHTRLGQAYKKSLTRKDYENAARAVRDLGATVWIAHAKSADETPGWELGPKAGAAGSAVGNMVEAAHANGLRFVAYYWIASDAEAGRRHPEWICRDPHGAPQSHSRRGQNLDITGPYREWVLKRLLALAGMGVDGFYFDWRHLPEPGCWGSSLEAEYRKATGRAPPANPGAADAADWHDFKSRRVADTFRYWQQRVEEKHPGLAFVVSSSSLAGLTTREFRSDHLDVGYTKTEFLSPERPQFDKNVFRGIGALKRPHRSALLGFAWAFLRSATAGRPPHVWAPSLPDTLHARAYVASIIAHGGIANMDVGEELLLRGRERAGLTPREALASAFTLGARLSALLKDTAPLHFSGVYFSEHLRDQRWPDHRSAWKHVVLPAVRSYESLGRTGLSPAVLVDRAARSGPPEGLALLAVPPGLPPATLSRLREGGAELWEMPANGALPPDVAAKLGSGSPVRAATAPQGMTLHAHVSRAPRPRIVLLLLEDFSWIRVGTGDYPNHPAPPPRPPVSRQPVTLILDLDALRPLLGTGTPVAEDALGGRALPVRMQGRTAAIEVLAPDVVTALEIRPAGSGP